MRYKIIAFLLFRKVPLLSMAKNRPLNNHKKLIFVKISHSGVKL